MLQSPMISGIRKLPLQRLHRVISQRHTSTAAHGDGDDYEKGLSSVPCRPDTSRAAFGLHLDYLQLRST
jgi:hypothetical protein